MKKTLIPALVFPLILISCGPAAEDREQMHARAKVFQDSIANAIRTSMAEAAAPGPNAQMPVDTAKKTSAAASTTAK